MDPQRGEQLSSIPLEAGARVAVIGGGPAGSFFSYFLLELADRMDLDLDVSVYEPRSFSGVGPASCNMCGGIISESLVQSLAAEGINLPTDVVQRGIDSYILHMDVGRVRIETPLHEKRIGAVHRASGPRDLKEVKWKSFDGFLQKLSVERGVRLINERVTELDTSGERPRIKTAASEPEPFDLVAVATGINAAHLKLPEGDAIDYVAPQTTKTFIREYFFGQEKLDRYLGSSMHVFLLNIPHLEFAAIIPKGDYASICLLGDQLDKKTYETFTNAPEVRNLMPEDWEPLKNSCQCSPKISVRGAERPFADRVVFIGDSGSTRLYKDGIGAAYRTAKSAARTAIFQGISADEFEAHYWPTCRSVERDNTIGKFMFGMTTYIQKSARTRRALLDMTKSEQHRDGRRRRMSGVLWDLFTGSATYADILKRTFHPAFLSRLSWNLLRCSLSRSAGRRTNEREVPA